METPTYLRQAWGSVRNAVIGCSAAVLFGIAVLLMSIYSVATPDKVYPAEERAVVRVEYYLPYPGMLPDSPFYRVKALRDYVKLALTTNSEKRIETMLLFADKRVNAAVALVEGGKTELGVSTATKAEKYLERAVTLAIEQKKAGRDVKSVMLKLTKATAKHVEVLEGLKEKTSGSEKDGLESALNQAKMLQAKISQSNNEAL